MGVYMARGSASYETGQKDVTSAASLLVPARPGRITVVISPNGTSDYCIGKAGVTMTTGLYIPAGAPCTVDTADDLYIISASNMRVSYMEYI